GRHAFLRVGVRHTDDHQSLAALARNDGFRFDQYRAGVERDPTLVLAVGMALGVAGLEERQNVMREIDRVRAAYCGSRQQGENGCNQPVHSDNASRKSRYAMKCKVSTFY